MRKYSLIIFLIIFSFFLYNGFVLATQNNTSISTTPKTLDEAETLGWKILSGFPKVLKEIWQEAVEIWKSIFRKIEPYIVGFWNKIKDFFRREVAIKKPEVKEELEKEKKEMKVEIPKAGKNIWERFKEIIIWWKED